MLAENIGTHIYPDPKKDQTLKTTYWLSTPYSGNQNTAGHSGFHTQDFHSKDTQLGLLMQLD